MRTRAQLRWIFVLTLGSATWLCAAQGRAQEDTQIAWRAAAGCPAPDVVRGRVTALLARQANMAADLRAVGEIDATARGDYELNLTLTANGHVARRTLRAPDCAALSEAGAWLIALAVDPTLVETEGGRAVEEATKSATATAAAAPSPPPVAPPARSVGAADTPAPDESEAARGPLPRVFRAGLFGGVFSAALPAPVGSLGARLGLGLGPFYAELGVAHLFSRRVELAGGGAADFTSQLVRLRGCMEWGERWRAAPCAGVSALRTEAQVTGIAVPGDEQVLWLTAGAALQLSFMVVAPLELVLDAGLELPVSARPRFDVTGLDSIATASFVSVHTTLGVGVRY